MTCFCGSRVLKFLVLVAFSTDVLLASFVTLFCFIIMDTFDLKLICFADKIVEVGGKDGVAGTAGVSKRREQVRRAQK